MENYRSPLVLEMVKNGVHEQVLEKGLASGGVVSEQQMIMQVLSGGRSEEDEDVKAAAGRSSRLQAHGPFPKPNTYHLSEFRPPVTYYTSIPNVLERPSRRFEAAMLKDLRRRLDSGQCSQEEIDEMTIQMTDEAAEVSRSVELRSDNTACGRLYRQHCHPEAFRADLSTTAHDHAPAHRPASRDHWRPQERDMGGTEDHRM